MLGATAPRAILLKLKPVSEMASHDESHMTGGMLGATLQHLLASPLAAHDEAKGDLAPHMLGAMAPVSEMAAHGESHMTGGMLGATLQHLLASPLAAHDESHMTGGMLGAMAPKMILLI